MKDLENSPENLAIFEKVFLKEIHDLETIFNEKLSKEKLKLYLDIFKEKLTIEQFMFSCKSLKENFKQEFCNKFPLPAHFLEIHTKLELTPEENFDRFYGELQQAVIQGNASQIGDDEFKQLVKAQGGQFNLSRWEESDWKFNRGRLKDFYIGKKNYEKKQELIGFNFKKTNNNSIGNVLKNVLESIQKSN